MLKSSIDIGSNSVLLLAAEVEGEKIVREILNESEITALGKDLDKMKVFHVDSMNDTFNALKKYAELLKKNGLDPSKTIITATEASRVAKNSLEFYTKVKNEIGFSVKIISGEGEAFYSSKGAALALRGTECVIMDIGGASTELIKVSLNPFKFINFISIPMGSVRGTDWKNNGEFDQKIDSLLLEFKDRLGDFRTGKICCVAGTMTSVGNMFLKRKSFDEDAVHGLKISLNDLKKIINENGDKSPDKLLEDFPFLSKRAKTIKAGSHIGYILASYLGVEEIEISTYGLRYGTIISKELDDKYVTRKH